MEEVLKELDGLVRAYMNDLIIFSESWEELKTSLTSFEIGGSHSQLWEVPVGRKATAILRTYSGSRWCVHANYKGGINGQLCQASNEARIKDSFGNDFEISKNLADCTALLSHATS